MVQDDKASRTGWSAGRLRRRAGRCRTSGCWLRRSSRGWELRRWPGRLVRLRRDRPRAAHAGRKVMALLFAMVLGADSIDDIDVLRAGRTRRLLGGWLPAPSTLGTFLRAFTVGHVPTGQAAGGVARRAWRAGAGPGENRLVIDVDSFVARSAAI